jgi:hypothetical protein
MQYGVVCKANPQMVFLEATRQVAKLNRDLAGQPRPAQAAPPAQPVAPAPPAPAEPKKDAPKKDETKS